jgi:hypothetical protein
MDSYTNNRPHTNLLREVDRVTAMNSVLHGHVLDILRGKNEKLKRRTSLLVLNRKLFVVGNSMTRKRNEPVLIKLTSS